MFTSLDPNLKQMGHCFGRWEYECIDVSETGFDLDDGFDIDEEEMVASRLFRKGRVLSNFDEGIDFDELNSGLLSVESKIQQL